MLEPPPPGVPPVPTFASYDNPAVVTVVFNRTLKPGSLDVGNWTWKAAGTGYQATSAVASGNTVTLNGTTQANGLAQERVNYAATPADVRDNATDAAAAAFLLTLEGVPP